MSTTPDLLSARFALIACFAALIGVGAYAYSLNEGLGAAQRAAAQAQQERDALKASLTKAEEQHTAATTELSACRQNVEDVTKALEESTQSKAGRRKAGG